MLFFTCKTRYEAEFRERELQKDGYKTRVVEMLRSRTFEVHAETKSLRPTKQKKFVPPEEPTEQEIQEAQKWATDV
jgi:hypothetical protein